LYPGLRGAKSGVRLATTILRSPMNASNLPGNGSPFRLRAGTT
jgi:hypothetical protein